MKMIQLRYVEAAARLGNFSQAARELYIAQPSLSQQIHALEEELGTPLFFRHSKSVSLTPAGRDFYEYVCRVLNDTDQIVADMRDYQKLERGHLRLGVLWIFAYLNLMDPIQRFSQAHRNLDFQLRLEGSSNLLQMLHRHEIDAAILICSSQMLNDPKLYYRLIQRDRICVMVHHLNSLSQHESLTIQDLEGKNVILPAKDGPLYYRIMDLAKKENVRLKVVCESSHNDINAQVVSQNFAISFSSSSVAEELNTGVYAVIPFEPEIWREVYFVTPRYRLTDPIVRELIGYL